MSDIQVLRSSIAAGEALLARIHPDDLAHRSFLEMRIAAQTRQLHDLVTRSPGEDYSRWHGPDQWPGGDAA